MWILAFILCASTCDDGIVIARSCASAEAWMRDGLRAGQTLRVLSCVPYDRDTADIGRGG